ncbi:MAG TPA: DUF4411 family protein [Candidatus Ornithomonoglobus merdipullorum]|uniref:DUF4411 family protein n=1 Tax=Candidatus Ornithomonoglobus merdipullorum TaxID=2840895 RepID=A0A9D1SF13_9FIRM|nr:DUF4411 family protein [Candidatus Ornithomonoglobus merdipullorum]
MSDEHFIIDSNSLITPYSAYYSFELAPGFWAQLERSIADGSVSILDMVKTELTKGNDPLVDWINNIMIGKYIRHSEPDIISVYEQVVQYIYSEPCYSDAAFMEWGRVDVADPWLIAASSVYGCKLVTFEKRNLNLNPSYPSKNPKIPDVAKEFGVTTCDLFYMMRTLGFRLN